MKSLRDYINLVESLEKPVEQGVAEGSLNELSKDTLKSYSNERGATIHADQRDAGGARTMAADKKKHGDTKASADWDDEASWLDKRAEKGAKGVAQATTKIAKKGVAEAGYGNHPSQRVDPRTGKKYVPPKSPLGQGVEEAAKWRDPKHKDKLYTQEPRSDEDDYYGDDDYYNPKPDDYPGAKNLKGGGEYDHNDPLRKGYGRYGTGSMNTHGKRKGMPNRDQVRSLKGSIKAAHGTHPKPNLPEGKGNGK